MIICITGIDCCGKGTQIGLLINFLQKNGHDVFLSKAYAQAEKECFSPFMEYWCPESIMFLFQALHAQQRDKAEKAIEHNKIVVADRWDESYLAYHSNHGKLENNEKLLKDLNEIAFKNIIPDITFLLKTRIDIAKKRCKHRGEDFFDQLPSEYHETMANAYLKIAKSRNWVILDGESALIDIHRKICDRLRQKFPDLKL